LVAAAIIWRASSSVMPSAFPMNIPFVKNVTARYALTG
jgi:hypothetical protein